MANAWKTTKDAMWNNSAIGSFLNAKSKYDSTDDEKEKDELGGVMANSVMSGLMSVGQGINGILNPALQAAEIGDTTMQKYDIANLVSCFCSTSFGVIV